MNLVCPSCEAAYDVPAGLGGRAVRCVRCGCEWRPDGMAGVPPPPPVSISVPPPMLSVKPTLPIPVLPETRSIYPVPPPFDPPPPPSTLLARAAPPPDVEPFAVTPAGSGAILGWLASLMLVFGLLWAAYAYREPIMAAWPPSIRMYAALGMV